MKGWFVVSILLVATATWVSASEPQKQIKIPQQCSDVFSIKVCDKIDSMATNLKLSVEAAKEAFNDAMLKGKLAAEEFVESCKTFYLEKVKSKTCEDFVSAETCSKLRNVAETLQLKAELVSEHVKNALLAGKDKTIEVYHQVLEYYNNELKGKSCEELLSKTKINPTVCTSLRNAAEAVKVKVDHVTDIVRDALINGYNTATAVVNNGIEKIKVYAKNITCENMLSPDMCSILREYSSRLKIAFPRIMEVVKDLLIKGYKATSGFLQAVYKITDAFIDCEHIFTADSCKLIREKVTSIGGKLSEFGAAVREYTMQVVDTTKDIYHKILTFTKDKWCRWFKVGCTTSKRSADLIKRSPSLKELLQKYKELLEKGVAEAREKLKQSLESMMDSLKIVDETLRDVMRQAIDDGKLKYTEIKDLLTKLVQVATGTNSTKGLTQTKRDLKEQLKQALQSAHGHMKTSIQHLLAKTSEELKKLHNYIQTLLSKVFDDKIKREIDDVQLLNIVGEELVEIENNKATELASLWADEVIDEAVANILEVENDSVITETMTKRDLSSGLNKIKELFGEVGDNLSDVLGKMRNLNIESIKEAFEKAGMKLIGVAEEVLKKIQEALSQ